MLSTSVSLHNQMIIVLSTYHFITQFEREKEKKRAKLYKQYLLKLRKNY